MNGVLNSSCEPKAGRSRPIWFTIVYDGDGNRVLETVAGVTTKYLVADINPTGYPQVIDERRLVGPGVDRAYTWGLQLIAVRDFQGSSTIDHYYGTDAA
jgi:hypothetical protein